MEVPRNGEVVVSGITADDNQSIAESLFPSYFKEAQTEYLAFRACGFKLREACQLVPVHHVTVSVWRKDPLFVEWEQKAVSTVRDTLVKEHLQIEFTRNYALLLIKDYKIIKKSMDDKEVLGKQEHEYLLRARSNYTPQQLQILTELARLRSGSEPTTFTELLRKISLKEVTFSEEVVMR